MSLTGVGASLVSTTAGTKFTATEAWKISRIGGLGRSVPVIDSSHLGISAQRSKHYVFGDLYDLRPITVECLVDPDDSNVWDSVDDTANPDVDTGPDHNMPLNLGISGLFTLSFPTTETTSPAKLAFTGAIVDDSGVELSNNDRLRTTFQIHPDGQQMEWTVASSPP